MRDKPALLILTSSFPRNPSDETCAYVSELARRLSRQFRVTVLAPADRDAGSWPPDSFDLVRSRSPLPYSLDWFQASRDLNDAIGSTVLCRVAIGVSIASYLLRAFLLSRRADVILSHWLVPGGLIGSLVAKARGKPHVGLEHSGALHLLSRTRWGRLLTKFIAKNSRQLVFVSEDLRYRFLRLAPVAANKTSVVRMGVRVSAFVHAPLANSAQAPKPVGSSDQKEQPAGDRQLGDQTQCSVLFIGRLTEIKGVDVLLRAVARIPGATLVIAGDGPRRSDLERLADSLSVDTIFFGRVGAEERRRLLNSCDAVAIPSLVMPDGRSEGTPVVCLEAMAAGRPVVASRVGGLSEIIDDGQNGLLFEPGDHASLAEKLELLFKDDQLKLRLGREARVTAAAFDWEIIGARFNRLLDSVFSDDAIDDNCRIQTQRARV